MRGRSLISAFLVLALLPIYSFGTICELNCRTAAMPEAVMLKSMAMSSMEPGSAHHPTAANHAQHHSHARHSAVKSDNALSVTTPQQNTATQGCCDSSQALSTSSCAAQNQNVLREPTRTTEFDSNPAILQTNSTIHSSVFQASRSINAPRTVVRDEAPASLTLRI